MQANGYRFSETISFCAQQKQKESYKGLKKVSVTELFIFGEAITFNTIQCAGSYINSCVNAIIDTV